MSRLVKIVDNKYIQIEEYKNPNICFNTNEYDNFEDYCTLRETFDPFEIFYENQELKKQLEEHKKLNGELREENKILKENAEHNDKVVDKVNWENNLLKQQNQKYKDVIDKLNNKINLLKTCEDKPKEDIIYPHWEICNETEQELLNILKEVSDE